MPPSKGIAVSNLAGAVFPDEPKSINPFSYFPLSVLIVAFVNEYIIEIQEYK